MISLDDKSYGHRTFDVPVVRHDHGLHKVTAMVALRREGGQRDYGLGTTHMDGSLMVWTRDRRCESVLLSGNGSSADCLACYLGTVVVGMGDGSVVAVDFSLSIDADAHLSLVFRSGSICHQDRYPP